MDDEQIKILNQILAAFHIYVTITEIIPGDKGFTLGFANEESARRFSNIVGERAYLTEPAKEEIPWYVTVAVEQS